MRRTKPGFCGVGPRPAAAPRAASRATPNAYVRTTTRGLRPILKSVLAARLKPRPDTIRTPARVQPGGVTRRRGLRSTECPPCSARPRPGSDTASSLHGRAGLKAPRGLKPTPHTLDTGHRPGGRPEGLPHILHAPVH